MNEQERSVTIEISARSVRRGDRVVAAGHAGEVDSVTRHIGGRELCLGLKDGGEVIVRRDARVEVEQADRAARIETHARISPDTDEIRSGHIVVVFDDAGCMETEAVVVKIEEGTATLRLPGTARRIRRPVPNVAHADSPMVREAVARG